MKPCHRTFISSSLRSIHPKIDERGVYPINGGLVVRDRNEALPAESDLWFSDYVVTEYARNMYIVNIR